MGDGGILQDTVAEIEDMGAIGERGKDTRGGLFHRGAAGDQYERVEIALHRQPLWKRASSPFGVDRFVEAERINAGFARVSGELFAGALGETDHRHPRVALV